MARPVDAIYSHDFVRIRQTRHGVIAYNGNDLIIGESLEKYGEWAEAELSGLLLQLLKPGDVVVDVGANIGTHTVAFAKRVGPDGHVLSFEPQLFSYRLLVTNATLNALTNVTTFRAFVGAEACTARVKVIDPSKPNNFGAISRAMTADGDDQVDTMTIDSLKIRRCNIIKIDVEGDELGVLRGARETIERLKPALFVEANQNEDALQRAMHGFDYNAYWFWTPFCVENNHYNNHVLEREGGGDVSLLATPKSWSIGGLVNARIGETYLEALKAQTQRLPMDDK